MGPLKEPDTLHVDGPTHLQRVAPDLVGDSFQVVIAGVNIDVRLEQMRPLQADITGIDHNAAPLGGV